MLRISRNPFHINGPTPSKKFVGRRINIKKMIDKFCSGEDESYAIVGGHQIGKSSILHVLEDILLSHLKQADIGDVYTIPLLVPLRRATAFNAPSDVFGFILHLLRSEICKPQKSMPLLNASLLESGLSKYVQTNPSSATLQDLEAFIEQVVTIASHQFGSVLIVILMDDIDKLLDFPWTSILFGNLRSLISDGVVKASIRLVMAGSGRYIEEVDEKGSPLIEGLIPLFLGPLSKEDIGDLIKRTRGINPDIANEIFLQSGGHPFITQHILYHLFEEGIATATLESVHREVYRFLDHQRANLDGWWKKIGEDGRSVYCKLRQHEDWVTLEELSREINSRDIQIDRGLKALYYHGVVIRDSTYKKYRNGSQLFSTWSIERCQTSTKKLEQSNQQKQPDVYITKGGPAVMRDEFPSSYNPNALYVQPITMEHSAIEKLVAILTKHAANSADSPNDFFRDLIDRADLPYRWKWQMAGVWRRNVETNARYLINWSITKGTNPDNSQPQFTILGSLLEILLKEVGNEDARIIAGLMIVYKHCLDQQLQEDLAIRYQIPLVMEPQIGHVDTNLYRAWRGPIPEDDLVLQSFLKPEP
ncbi:MAG TPA: hypothetical protein VEP90_02460, partial [Methylomirabilota bacterium]|nr:hypothetical protein [Methylomirabilota bacterium]